MAAQIGSRPVTYFPKGSLSQGRRYPRGQGGAALGRKARLLLFGLTHLKWDLRAAHTALFAEILLQLDPCDHIGLLLAQPDDYRAAIQQAATIPLGALARPHGATKAGGSLVKFLARISLMASPSQVRAHVLAQGGAWTPKLGQLAREVDCRKQLVQERLYKLDCAGRAAHEVTPRNALYFALESLEAKLMATWLQALPQQCPSISWIGDAFWIHRSLPAPVVLAAFRGALSALGLLYVQVASTDLVAKRAAVPWTPPWTTHHTALTHPVYPPRQTAAAAKGLRLHSCSIPDKWDCPAPETWLALCDEQDVT